MGEIYSSSTRVVIWLGDELKVSRLALWLDSAKVGAQSLADTGSEALSLSMAMGLDEEEMTESQQRAFENGCSAIISMLRSAAQNTNSSQGWLLSFGDYMIISFLTRSLRSNSTRHLYLFRDKSLVFSHMDHPRIGIS
jgi:hypothetical protein